MFNPQTSHSLGHRLAVLLSSFSVLRPCFHEFRFQTKSSGCRFPVSSNTVSSRVSAAASLKKFAAELLNAQAQLGRYIYVHILLFSTPAISV